MTKPMKPEEMKRKAGPHDNKAAGYWEPDFDLVAALEAIEIEDPEFAKTGRPRYWTEERALQVVKEFIDWAKQPEALVSSGFFALKGLHDKLVDRLVDTYPRFASVYTIGKQLVGMNRERAAGKKFDAGLAKKYAALYSAHCKDWELKIRDLDAKANSKEITVNVRGKMDEPVLDEDKSETFRAVKRKLKDVKEKDDS